jgi:hypothetical protein
VELWFTYGWYALYTSTHHCYFVEVSDLYGIHDSCYLPALRCAPSA